MIRDKYKNIVSILVISTGFVVLYLVNHRRFFLDAAVIISIASLISPYMAVKINWLWMWLGKILGYIANTIILTAVYFILLVPIALISNKKRRRLLFLNRAPVDSTFTIRDHIFDGKDMENVW